MLPTPAAPWASPRNRVPVFSPCESGNLSQGHPYFIQRRMIRATTTPATTCAATSVRNCHIGATSFRGLAHSPNFPKSRSRRNAERPGTLPACCVTCPWCGACSPRRWGRCSAPASSLYLLTCHAPGAHPEGLVVFPLHTALHAAVVAGVYHLEQLIADHPVKGTAEPPEVVPRHKPHDGA